MALATLSACNSFSGSIDKDQWHSWDNIRGPRGKSALAPALPVTQKWSIDRILCIPMSTGLHWGSVNFEMPVEQHQ